MVLRPRRAAAGQTGRVSVATGDLHQRVLGWYDRHARDLPWRDPDAGAWAVLVSEIMLQQTPVARVLPAYRAWLDRWPTAAALAADSVGEAVRAWGRLGYPRRAMRLHQTATAITTRHGGVVPDDVDALRELPGIGDYTAAAVAVFAYHRRLPVLDTNVRRVLARAVDGTALPSPSVRVAELETARGLLPVDSAEAARWSVAVMELGALVCTARGPRCDGCPIADRCRWRGGGYPAYDGPRRPAQSYDGTDRQCRGALLAVLRDATGPVHRWELEAAWDRSPQRERALDGLVADGLVEPLDGDRFALPR
jgi:A/G-specific adenine glycosylase